ncbi:type I methionyl aminopeptidase [bacterium DOLZORAL124_38_8]|nr:MAG: type I methionyl aminopeptidase [bacterium DOLZORAL124_38_8]
MRIIPKTEAELELMRHSGKILQAAQEAMKAEIKAGVTFKQLDAIAEKVILEAGAKPAFKGVPGMKFPFPATICAMRNDEIVHGIPDDNPLEDGDLITIDCGAIWKGYYSDAAFSLIVGGDDKNPERAKFEKTVKKALMAGCAQAKAGNTTGDIGFAIQRIIQGAGYSICKEYTGHGLGKTLHEDPNVFNYGKPGKGVKLVEGMTIAIEPIVAMGNPRNKTLSNGWTVVTADGSDACQWEHFGVVRKDGFEIFA